MAIGSRSEDDLAGRLHERGGAGISCPLGREGKFLDKLLSVPGRKPNVV